MTYVDVIATNEIEAREKFNRMCDDGIIYQEEMEQCNVEDEDVTIIDQCDVIWPLRGTGRITGTSFHGDEVLATMDELIAVIGEPACMQNDGSDKTNVEWWFTIGDDAYSLYDWKEYRPLERDELIAWHIGGKSYTGFAKKIIENLLKEKRK